VMMPVSTAVRRFCQSFQGRHAQRDRPDQNCPE
jgi:hypothetical protein